MAGGRTARAVYPRRGCQNPETVVYEGIFRPDTAAAPVVESGRGVTVAHAATGLFTLTLPVRFKGFLSYGFCISMAAATDLKPMVRIKSVADKTIQVAAVAIATDTDIAANADNAISYRITVQNSLSLT